MPMNDLELASPPFYVRTRSDALIQSRDGHIQHAVRAGDAAKVNACMEYFHAVGEDIRKLGVPLARVFAFLTTYCSRCRLP